MSRYKHVEFRVYDTMMVNSLMTERIEDVLKAPNIRYYIYTITTDESESQYIYGYIQHRSAYTHRSWTTRMGAGGRVSPLSGHENHTGRIREIRRNSERGCKVWEGGTYIPRVWSYTPYSGMIGHMTLPSPPIDDMSAYIHGGNDAIGGCDIDGSNLSWMEFIADGVEK